MFIYTLGASGESSEDIIDAPLPAKRIKLGGTCVNVTIIIMGKGLFPAILKFWHG